ncbi:MAG: peptide deformylase [Candidatus Saccharibacteria bacterium]|nr:peptide deformylase [Candidatus Saccharibacteria bacterium]MBR1795650.1 peptide deformylase [Candidatus Saccharibacteria bacterium]MDO4987284.1 peptide deformylase [Candidatus Saccharibacteria bacterium]
MGLKIITVPDSRLRQKSIKARISDPEVVEAIETMRKECIAWEKEHPHELSAAMAAPQLGVNKRVIIVRDDLDDKDNQHFTALLNPEIIKTDGKIERDYEGCLSIPYLYANVPRPDKVRIKAELEDGTPVRIKADGFLARTLQHEIDHLEGVLFIDHVKDDPKAFARMNDKGDLDPVDYDKEVKGNKELWPDDED